MNIPISAATHFSMAIPGIQHDLEMLGFHGTESLNTPYRMEIEVIRERPDLDLETLLHQPASLAFSRQGAGLQLLSSLPLQIPAPALAVAQVSLLQNAQNECEQRCLTCEVCAEGACDMQKKGGVKP